jgi:hypothetical protein
MMILSCVIADSSLELRASYAVALSRTQNLRLKETVTTGGELEDCLKRANAHLVLWTSSSMGGVAFPLSDKQE